MSSSALNPLGLKKSNFEYRIQSTSFCSTLNLPLSGTASGRLSKSNIDIRSLLDKDVGKRVSEAGDNLVFNIFQDEAFGFSINEKFAQNFHGIFLTCGGTISQKNLQTEIGTANFLNKIITTVACFFRNAGLNHLKPLRYFSAVHANTPIRGAIVDRKPDIVLIRLVNEQYTREDRLDWVDVQALVEHTTSKDPPIRMAKTIFDKNYLMFCDQPEKDFIINLCITYTGVYVVVSDHAGVIDTDLISFDKPSGALLFLRMVVGFAFLPDKWLGIDDTMIRRVRGQRSSALSFEVSNPPFQSEFVEPKITLIHWQPPSLDHPNPFAITTDEAKPDENSSSAFDTIAIGERVYKVLGLLFKASSFIGRATKVFLVRCEDGREGVLKDSHSTVDRRSEESILKDLVIPFGPDIVDHCVLGDTDTFRKSVLTPALILESREKRRTVTYPAGIHISDFSSLWELMVIFLDVSVAIYFLECNNLVHRDISYANILIRGEGKDSAVKAAKRREIMHELDLSEIDSLRTSLGCREGLLIDFDYASLLLNRKTAQADASNVNRSPGENQCEGQSSLQSSSQGESEADFEVIDNEDDSNTQPFNNISGTRTGTPPFMAIELLLYAPHHRAIHDAESLIYVLIFLCTHLSGPGQVNDPPVFGSGSKHSGSKHPSGITHWMDVTDLDQLGHIKSSQMLLNLKPIILNHLSSYFKPLAPHIYKLWTVLFPPASGLSSPSTNPGHSKATLRQFINALKTVLLDKNLIDSARQNLEPDSESDTGNRRKRSRPGELIISESNGWDPAFPKKQMDVITTSTRRKSFMRKRGH